jgi:signal transduction histidine kinase
MLMFRSVVIAAASIAGLTMAATAFAQQAKLGTAAEAKAMLEKAVAAVKADKVKALASFNAGTDGFKDRDLQPFCFNKVDGKLVASTVPSLVGTDVRVLKDKTGKAFGEEVFKAATEGKRTEVSYMFPRPGETEPVQKVSFVTGVGDLGCGVGYHP